MMYNATFVISNLHSPNGKHVKEGCVRATLRGENRKRMNEVYKAIATSVLLVVAIINFIVPDIRLAYTIEQ